MDLIDDRSKRTMTSVHEIRRTAREHIKKYGSPIVCDTIWSLLGRLHARRLRLGDRFASAYLRLKWFNDERTSKSGRRRHVARHRWYDRLWRMKRALGMQPRRFG
jgi:hypothetical protein